MYAWLWHRHLDVMLNSLLQLSSVESSPAPKHVNSCMYNYICMQKPAAMLSLIGYRDWTPHLMIRAFKLWHSQPNRIPVLFASSHAFLPIPACVHM